MSLLLAVAGATVPPVTPEEPAGGGAVIMRRRIVVHGRRKQREGDLDEAIDDIAEAVKPEPAIEPRQYVGPSAKEIATAALLEASRRLSQDLAAKAAAEEQARVEAATAQIALEYAQQQAEIAAQAVRRTQDEEALIALLLAM